MRRTIVAVLAVLIVIALPWAPLAQAQGYPVDTTLVDELFRMGPGVDLRQCFDVPEIAELTIFVWSPGGRTGETAAFNFSDGGYTARPRVQLFITEIPADQIMSTHLAPAGSYCYGLTVSDTQSPEARANQDPAAKPYKNVHLKIISTPYAS